MNIKTDHIVGDESNIACDILVERDVDVPMRDGLRLKADVFRPVVEGTYPVILCMGVYHKDMDFTLGPNATPSQYPNFEALTPEDYVPHGYVLVRIDTRGSGRSPGFLKVFDSVEESKDYYDAIEWAASQPWSTGAIGLSGTSYLGMNQWAAAGMQPPHLKCIVPHEALTDMYRHSTYPGGIYREAFQSWYMDRMSDHLLRHEARDGDANQNVGAENTTFLFMQHRLDGPFWKGRGSDAYMNKINVPMLTISAWPNWGAVGHLRGSTEGFKEAASKHKRLVIHDQQFIDGSISIYGKLDTEEHLRWYDRHLKGVENEVDDMPPVKLAIRNSTQAGDYVWREENEWPLARTRYTPYYLNAVDGGTLDLIPPSAAAEAEYLSGPLNAITQVKPQEAMAAFMGKGIDTTGVTFTTAPFTQDTEVTGELALYIKAASSLKDMDVHASVSIIQPDGREELVTRGWLKASHRKLDEKRSTLSMPYHTHDQEQYLAPGEPVDLAIDIWPTSMVYRTGSRLRLRIAPTSSGFYGYTRAASRGHNTIFTGGDNPAHLLLPIIPPNC